MIKKSDNSSDIAKHQTFHHKYFQRGRPDLLKYLQRSRKTHASADDDAGSVKKPKVVTSGVQEQEKSVLEQLADLVRKTTESELLIKSLQQENANLTFAVQKLQQQDEIKQRAIVSLEETVRVMELHMTQAFQQLQAQVTQANQPLPFNRESSLSAVNPSALMRYLSMNPGLSRLATPPFGQLSGPGAFTAAAAAESLVQQANENAAAAAAGIGGPTLARHPRMKAADNMGGSTNDTIEPTLRRHPNMKNSESAAVNAGAMGAAPTLPRHPRMKTSDDSSGSAGGTVSLTRQGFRENSFGERQGLNDNESSHRGASSPLPPSMLSRVGGGNSPVPPSLGRATASPVPPTVGRAPGSPIPPSMSLLQNGGIGGGFGLQAALGQFPGVSLRGGALGLSNVLGPGAAREPSTSPMPGSGGNSSSLQHQGGGGGDNILERDISSIGNAVTRDESFGISSLMELSRGST